MVAALSECATGYTVRMEEFIPGRPSSKGVRIEKVYKEIAPGALDIGHPDHRVVIPASDGTEEDESLSSEHLRALGLDAKDAHLTDLAHPDAQKIIEAAYRKREGIPMPEVAEEPVSEPAPDVLPTPGSRAIDGTALRGAAVSAESTPVSLQTYREAWTDAQAKARDFRGGVFYSAAIAGGIVGIGAGAVLMFGAGLFMGMWWLSGKVYPWLEKLLLAPFKKGKHEKKDGKKNDHGHEGSHDHGKKEQASGGGHAAH